jgi:AraC family transcriptional regulator of adaptative response/methylated-DNA-[protein]-cysteine methyltransferase
LKNATLDYSFGTTVFGDVILASIEKGLCYLAFENKKDKALEDLKNRFPMASFQEKSGTP